MLMTLHALSAPMRMEMAMPLREGLVDRLTATTPILT